MGTKKKDRNKRKGERKKLREFSFHKPRNLERSTEAKQKKRGKDKTQEGKKRQKKQNKSKQQTKQIRKEEKKRGNVHKLMNLNFLGFH